MWTGTVRAQTRGLAPCRLYCILKTWSANNHYGTVMELLLTRRPPRRTLRCCTLFISKACRQSAAYGQQNASSFWSSPNTAFLNTVSCEKRPSCFCRTPEHPATANGSDSSWCVYLCVWIVCTCSTNSDDVLALRRAGGMSLVKHSICFFVMSHVPCVLLHTVQCTFEDAIKRITKHLISGANCYMFRQQAAIVRECINNKGAWAQHVIQALFALRCITTV
jgi:hypothetical protein